MSNRLFRSDRHRHLSLIAPPDAQPGVRISHPIERFCCDQMCSQGRDCPVRQACALPEVEPAPIKPGGRMALVLAVLVMMLIAALVFGGSR